MTFVTDTEEEGVFLVVSDKAYLLSFPEEEESNSILSGSELAEKLVGS